MGFRWFYKHCFYTFKISARDIHSGQMVLIALAIILLFGVNKIPQLMKGLGRGIKDFKDEMKDDSKIEDGEEK